MPGYYPLKFIQIFKTKFKKKKNLPDLILVGRQMELDIDMLKWVLQL